MGLLLLFAEIGASWNPFALSRAFNVWLCSHIAKLGIGVAVVGVFTYDPCSATSEVC